VDRNEKVVYSYMDDAALSAEVVKVYSGLVQARAEVAYQEHCSIGELLGPDRESQHLEYKSTLRTRAGSGEVYKPLESAIIKAIAGFMNSRDGGTLLIGVADDGSPFGLEADYASLRRPGKDGRDLFQLHLVNILIAAMGEAAAANVSIQLHRVDGENLCRVHVRPSAFPVHAEVTVDRKGQFLKKTAFFVRIGNGTRELTDPDQQQRYSRGRWPSAAA
jgi:predicted HTH transcriptional regulator